jgi:exodeoxyribonuclease VII large subunit
MTQKCAYVRREAEGYRFRLQAKGPAGRLRERVMQLDHLQERMANACWARVDSAREAVRALNLDLRMKAKIRETENRLRMTEPAMRAAMRQRLQGTEGRYKILEAKVRILSPQDHLNRGYAFVADSRGKAVQSVSSLVRGELLNITLRDGSLGAKVQQIRPEGLKPQSVE